MIAGVVGGLGERLGLDAVVLRLAVVVLAFAGGFGVVLYALAWLASTDPGDRTDAPGAPRGVHGLLATGFVTLGMLLVLRDLGVWFGDGLVTSVALAAVGSAVIWARGDESDRARVARVAALLPRSAAEPRVSKLRLVAGAVLVVAGMARFLAASETLVAARNVAFGVTVAATGTALILGPWIWRMGRQLAEERRERIRSEERAEVAAHLHDSVLQTLAMIQRTGDPTEMVTLARGQERELRAWLYGRGALSSSSTTLRAAFEEMASRIERMHRVPVEAVVVGDGSMDEERLRALVEAAGEAATNAARHSKAPVVSVYAEVEDGEVRAFVRDEGVGFDVDRIPADRRGIAYSIHRRMRRHGGTATITSRPGEGTEVQLRMPRRAS